MTPNTKFQVLLPLLLFFFLTSWQFPALMIKGKLLDPKSGEHIENALIKLYTEEAILETYSDEDGRFNFKKLKAGHYDVEILKSGYKATKIRAVEVYEDQPSYLMVKLKAERPQVFSIIKEDE